MTKEQRCFRIKYTGNLLNNFRKIKSHIKILDRRIHVAKHTLRCVDAINSTSIGSIGNSNISNIVEEEVLREIGKIEKMEHARDIYSNIVLGMKEAIDSLKGDERKIIYLYYLVDIEYTWQEIAKMINTSEVNCRGYMREQALLNISEALMGVDGLENLIGQEKENLA